MEDMAYNELALEKRIKAQFGIDIDIKHMIAYRIPAGPTVVATIFMSGKKHLYLYLSAQSKLTLGDVKKIVTRMGLKAQSYLPPKGRPDYFKEIGTAKFVEVFPGRKNISDMDILFYKTLVSYNPALILISEVCDGKVRQYDSDSNTGWRATVKLDYRKVRPN